MLISELSCASPPVRRSRGTRGEGAATERRGVCFFFIFHFSLFLFSFFHDLFLFFNMYIYNYICTNIYKVCIHAYRKFVYVIFFCFCLVYFPVFKYICVYTKFFVRNVYV